MKKFWSNREITMFGSISVFLCIVITVFKAPPILNVCDELGPWENCFSSISTSLCVASVLYLFSERS